MYAETVSLIEPSTTARTLVMPPHAPVRVFLLSDRRLLREGLAHVLRHHADIQLVGSDEFSAAISVESIASGWDVLLVDPVSIGAYDVQTLEMPNFRFSNLRIVTIKMEAGISDVLSSILMVEPDETDVSSAVSRNPYWE